MELDTTQVRAAQILLDKAIPNLMAIEYQELDPNAQKPYVEMIAELKDALFADDALLAELGLQRLPKGTETLLEQGTDGPEPTDNG